MAGTGSNSTREAIRLTRAAKKCGADGVLMVGPYYNKPTQEGYYRHFAAVAEAVDIPIVLYNIPGRTASNMTAGNHRSAGRDPATSLASRKRPARWTRRRTSPRCAT